MRQQSNSFYILQVSDFHISEESKDSARKALKAVTDKISAMNINIRYLIYTGDMINSKDISNKISQQYGTDLKDETYDNYVYSIVVKRFGIAKEIMEEFVKNLDIMQKI